MMRMRKVVRKKRTVTALAQTPTSVAQDDSSDVSDLEKFDLIRTPFGSSRSGSSLNRLA